MNLIHERATRQGRDSTSVWGQLAPLCIHVRLEEK